MTSHNTHPRLLFARLIRSIQPRAVERLRSAGHLKTIRQRLSKSFDLSRIIPIGSFSRSTAITRVSDRDLLVLLKRNEAKWGDQMVSSATVLRRVRSDLDSRFTATTVRADQQAAVVHFRGGRDRFDVVPAVFSHFDGKRPIYGIPDSEGRWLATSPLAHNQWLKQAQNRSGGKLTKVAQLLKYWTNMRTATTPTSSFYLEMWLALNGICVGARSYTEVLADAFDRLDMTECPPIQDPIGISGWIHATRTEAQLRGLLAAVNTCAFHAQRALLAEDRRNNAEARRQWNIVFNGGFV